MLYCCHPILRLGSGERQQSNERVHDQRRIGPLYRGEQAVQGAAFFGPNRITVYDEAHLPLLRKPADALSRLDSQLEDTDIPMDGQTRLWHSTPAPPVDRLDPADGPIRIRQRGAVPGAVRNCGRQRERGRGGRAAAMMALCGTDRSRRDGGPMLFPTVAGDEICGGTAPYLGVPPQAAAVYRLMPMPW